MLANTLFLLRRFSDAVPLYEQALELDKGRLAADDADLGASYANVGRAYDLAGNFSKADTYYEFAVTTYKAAIKARPEMLENYSTRLQNVLYEHAQVKDAEGQTDVAAMLRREALAVKNRK